MQHPDLKFGMKTQALVLDEAKDRTSAIMARIIQILSRYQNLRGI